MGQRVEVFSGEKRVVKQSIQEWLDRENPQIKSWKQTVTLIKEGPLLDPTATLIITLTFVYESTS